MGGRSGKSRCLCAQTGTATSTNEFIGDTVIDTYSSEETQQYLARAKDIYIDRNVKPTYKDTSEHPITQEQRVVVRHLQPPALPPPGVMKQTIYRFKFTHLYMILATHY